VLSVARTPSAWFLFVERGTLAVAAGSGLPVPIGSDRQAARAPGELIAVPAGAGFAARNEGTAPATALAVAIVAHASASPAIAPGGGSAWNPETGAFGLAWDAAGKVVLAPGVTARVLTTATGVPVPAGATLALGRIVLAPGAALSLPATAPLVLAVEHGKIELSVEQHIAWTIEPTGLMRKVEGRAAVAAGEGALTTTGPASLWQAGAEPAVVLVLAVLPAPD
jgi:hypothetical protein